MDSSILSIWTDLFLLNRVSGKFLLLPCLLNWARSAQGELLWSVNVHRLSSCVRRASSVVRRQQFPFKAFSTPQDQLT